MREIDLPPAARDRRGGVCDLPGPSTDPACATDIRAGLPPLREEWIRARGDVEEQPGRFVRPEDNGLKAGETGSVPLFDRAARRPLRARAGHAGTQLAYARAGPGTPELEYIAIRAHPG